MEGLTVVFDRKERKKGEPASSSRPLPLRKSEKQKSMDNANRGVRSHCPHHLPPADYASTGPCDPTDLSSDSSDTDDSVNLPKSRSAHFANVNNSNRNTRMKKKKTMAANRPSKSSNQSLPKVGVHSWFDDDDDDNDDNDIAPCNSRESQRMPKKAPRNHSKRSSENVSTHRRSNTPICPVPRPGRVPAFDTYPGGEEGEVVNRPSKSSNWSLPEVGVHGWFNDDVDVDDDDDDGDDDNYDIAPHNSRESSRMPKKAPRNHSKRSSENNNMCHPSNTPIRHVPRPGRVPTFDNYPGGAVQTWSEGSIGGDGHKQNAMVQTSSHLMSSNMNMKKEENQKQNQKLVAMCVKVARFSLLGI